MAAMYVLQSASTAKFYIGSALQLAKRLDEHHRGHSPYTRGRGPWVLVYQEEYPTLAEARRRERQLKAWKSHRLVQEVIANTLSAPQSGHS